MSKGNESDIIHYYKLAADNGHGEAQFYYAECLRKGEFVAQDLEESARYYKLSADNGVAKAALVYARWCEEGTIIAKDMEQAEKYFEMAHNAMSV